MEVATAAIFELPPANKDTTFNNAFIHHGPTSFTYNKQSGRIGSKFVPLELAAGTMWLARRRGIVTSGSPHACSPPSFSG